MNRCHACAIAGLIACTHLSGIGFMEAMHPRREEARPLLTVDALPPEPDHTHLHYDRVVRIIDVGLPGTTTPSGGAPPTILRARPAPDSSEGLVQTSRPIAPGPSLMIVAARRWGTEIS
jgi:hypothetical protein